MDEQLIREYISTVKSEKRRRSTESIGKLFRVFGKAVPKGIRSPDSLVTNMHLYSPNYKGRTKLR